MVKSKKINLIQSHLLGSNVYCCLAGFLCRIPVVCTFHGFVDVGPKDWIMNIKTYLINWGSKKIVFVSNSLKKNFTNQYGFSLKKSLTIYNGIDIKNYYYGKESFLRRELGFSTDHILIGSIGNIRLSKGYDFLLKAARIVIDESPDCRFIVAGDISVKLYDDLLKLRKTLQLEEYFKFLGHLKNVNKFFNSIDIFVLSSISEGLSIVTIEAVAFGKPIVACRSGGPEEILKFYENSVLVEPKNANDLSKGILRTVKLVQNNSIVAKKSNKELMKYFSLKKMIQNYEELYNKVL